MSRFSFEYPWVFLLIIVFIVCAKWCKERSNALFFPHLALLTAHGARRSSWLFILKWVGIVMAITALASPVVTHSFIDSKKKGRDIVLVIDSSDSMRQRGFDPNDIFKSKFDVVKEVVDDFISRRKNDRIGIVTFADVAFIASPLTFEKSFLHEITQMQRLGIAGKRTAINDAVVQAYRMLEKSEAKSKVVILLTDGMDNMSKVTFSELKKLIESRKVKLYTVGIGGPGDYDPNYLAALAKAGHGEAFAASNADTLKRVYDEIDRMEKSEIKAKKVLKHTFLYIYPLFVAIMSLLFFIYLRNKKGV